MSVVITSKYRSDLTRLFVEDTAVNDYYLFASATANVQSNGVATGLDVFNTNNSKNEFLEKTLFGRKIDSEEVLYMIKNRPWVVNTVYDQYDDTVDMSDKNYYAVVYPTNNETGDYRIYKCLFNNYGAESISPPNYSDNTPDQIYEMADGYVWKFIYSLSVLEFEKFNTQGYIPILEVSESTTANTSNTSTSNTSITESSVSQIFVENPETNGGYEKVEGSIRTIDTDSGEIEIVALRYFGEVANNAIEVNSPSDFNRIENYYAGYSLYVTTDIGSEIYKVVSYQYNLDTGTALITLEEGVPNDGVLIENSDYQLLPRIEIRGDGSGARAIPVVSEEGTITRVRLINKGSGYNNVRAFIPAPFGFDPTTLNSLDEEAILRPVLSPPGGHGNNKIDELSCSRALVYVSITEADNQIIPVSNDFGSVGIVKNPQFKEFPAPNAFDNRLELNVGQNTLGVNENIRQLETSDTNSDFYNEIRFSGKIHQRSGEVIYLCEYMGPYPNDFVPAANTTYANTDFSDISLNPELPLLSIRNQIISINTDNGFTTSPYVQRTGEVFYMNKVFPITRTPSAKERFKILLEF